jgi:hypothetical protein
MGPQIGKKPFEVLHRTVGTYDQVERHAGNRSHRHQVLRRVERHLRVQVRIDRHGATGRHQQRVAVSRRLGDEVRPKVACGAPLVFHDDRLPQRFVQRRSDEPGQLIGSAARRKVHHDLDGLRGPALGLRRHSASPAERHHDRCQP